MVVWSGTRFKDIATTKIGEETSYMYLRFTAKNLILKSWSINFINFNGLTINFLKNILPIKTTKLLFLETILDFDGAIHVVL